LAITGLTNAYNIIDGLNGLACLIAMTTLFFLGSIGYELNDLLIVQLCTYIIGGLLGILFWNFPKGLIFIGDGGAYLVGIWIAAITILMINRHSEISPWFAVLINAYPILETIYTIFRRTIYNKANIAHPDAMHLHSIIFRRFYEKNCKNTGFFSANPKAAVVIWLVSIIPILTAVIFSKSTQALIAFFIIYSMFYVIFYNYMLKNFKSQILEN
jgi:UDP-N-acetylmuramyl pentapeptide phosphotransferase/UDP-N-acetylglucosamine-1-phosphate transferase